MSLSKYQPTQLKQLIVDVIKSDSSWRIVSRTATLVRAIPKQLEDALPIIGSSTVASGSAWLTLDFWIDGARLGVFWRSNPVRDREARNTVLKALVETPETGFVYQGTKGPWSEGDTPPFSGKTVSNGSWWPSGEEPDLQAARDVIRDQLRKWRERLPSIAEVVSPISKASSTKSLVAQSRPVSINDEFSDPEEQVVSKRTIGWVSMKDAEVPQKQTGSSRSKIKPTPPLPDWVREDPFQPHYTNIHELLKNPRLSAEQRLENSRRLYGTETMEGFNDWNASVLLLAKDPGPTKVFRRLIEEADGVHCQSIPCTQPWRHAVPGEKGSQTNMNLRDFATIIPGAKLYGSVMAGLLRNDGKQSGALPSFYDVTLQRYVRRILEEIVFPAMNNLQVIICLGDDACRVVGTVIGSAELSRSFRTLRDAAKPIDFHGKQVFASFHTSPLAMADSSKVERARRVWLAAKRVLEENSKPKLAASKRI